MKTVMITGASSGFGREAVKLFQQKGWNVIASMRSTEKAEGLADLSNVLITKLDVEDASSITAAIQTGAEHFGGIDVLINNAGFGVMGVFESATKEQIKRQYDVNVFGLIDVTQAALPYLRKSNDAVIINVSSFGGLVALPFGSLYNSSKFAVEGLSESLFYELAPLNIRVKIIEPGGVATNFRNGLDIIKNSIPEYDPLMSTFFSRYGKVTEHLTKATPEQVAATMYSAATDASSQLRYAIGDDAKFYIDAKFSNDEKDFTQTMKQNFLG